MPDATPDPAPQRPTPRTPAPQRPTPHTPAQQTRTPHTPAPQSTDADLRRRFAAALHTARGPAGGPDPAPYADALLARWAEPHRRYHTTAHLTAVLDHIDTLAEYADSPDLVRLAAWFHDAVHRADRSENEERSARLAERALTEAGLSGDRTAEVARLVRLTAGHATAPEDRDGAVLCDADLATLAAAPTAYAAYATAVRAEYGFLPDAAFRAGRAALLEQLLALPGLFRTPYGIREWEARARANVTEELRSLTGPHRPR
ncbi:hypothetical protein ACFY7Z_06035 [Streptomyces sp. NPDC012623]|uniref:HD domain-containing protein n=1 Tax=unclassified Streptomyces TaxID=2593676 RepID=UPI0036CC6000